MATFGYEAIDKSGTILKGSMEADSLDALRAHLKNQELTLIAVKEQSLLTKDINIEIGGYPKPRDLSVFCRQFVSMSRAGVTILECLKLLEDQTENKQLAKAISGVRGSVEKGETLSDSLALYPKVFPELLVNMVAAGEASGSLDVALERMSIQFESSAKIKALVKKAMIYPIMIIILAIAMVVVMLVVVIPKYTKMFEEMDTELPGITMAVKKASDFLINNWFIVVPIVVGIIVFFSVWGKANSGKHFLHMLKLKLPGFGQLEVKKASSMMARTLSTLMSAGVPMVEAVEIVSNTMDNVYFKEAMERCHDDIVIGQPLSRPLEDCGLFPPMVYHMARIGEESGNVEDMLTKLADYYDEEVEMGVQSFMSALEPMIIIFMALIVGVLVAACFAPMISMYSALDNL